MKKLIIASAVVTAAVFSSSAFAQAKNFEGFTAGINVSSIGGTSTLNDGTGGSVDFGQQSFVPGVELGYNFAATESVVLGLTATYDFADSKLGNFGNDNDLNANVKGQNRMSINFKPGFVLTPSTMIYATVGYNSMKVQGAVVDITESKTLNGIGYGLGLSVMATKNVFVKAEVQQVTFNSWNLGGGASLKPNLTVGTIGVGYKF